MKKILVIALMALMSCQHELASPLDKLNFVYEAYPKSKSVALLNIYEDKNTFCVVDSAGSVFIVQTSSFKDKEDRIYQVQTIYRNGRNP